jgi:hypothetical protein
VTRRSDIVLGRNNFWKAAEGVRVVSPEGIEPSTYRLRVPPEGEE